jgi:hypothetical protein
MMSAVTVRRDIAMRIARSRTLGSCSGAITVCT